MILNYYENKIIKNALLPAEWKSQESLDELLNFLQSNWEQRAIFYDDGKVNSKQQFLDFIGQKNIRTKDYVGTIVYKGHQLNIFPKVFKEFKDDDDRKSLDLQHLMHNLVKWIEYTAKIDYPYISIAADMENTDDLQELFVSLYVRYVKAALDRGLFFRYEEKTEDLPTIRGRLDIKDYITKKYPTGQFGKFLCSYSTFEFDNLLNRVIKCTLKFVWNIATPSNQKIIRNLLNKLGEVSDQNCTPRDCDTIQLSKIANQKKMLQAYARENHMGNTKFYVDDGYTGTNFNRPGFQELLDDIEMGYVGTIIVKDMSRFGREYLQVGYYTENYFPDHNIRFIAINDNVDCVDGATDIEIIPKLLKTLYEDKLSGKTSEDNYCVLSQEYSDEREQLQKKILKLRRKLTEMGEKENEREEFIHAIRKFMEMRTLTKQVLNELIDHIDVYETQGTGKNKTQRLVIYYKFVGYLDINPTQCHPNYTADIREGVAIEYVSCEPPGSLKELFSEGYNADDDSFEGAETEQA